MHEDQQPYAHRQHNDGDPELNVSQNAAPYSGLPTVLTMHTNPCRVSKERNRLRKLTLAARRSCCQEKPAWGLNKRRNGKYPQIVGLPDDEWLVYVSGNVK
jgi:hypothetical protein